MMKKGSTDFTYFSQDLRAEQCAVKAFPTATSTQVRMSVSPDSVK